MKAQPTITMTPPPDPSWIAAGVRTQIFPIDLRWQPGEPLKAAVRRVAVSPGIAAVSVQGVMQSGEASFAQVNMLLTNGLKMSFPPFPCDMAAALLLSPLPCDA